MKRLALMIAALFAAGALAASFAPTAEAYRGGGPKGYGQAYVDTNRDGVCDR